MPGREDRPDHTSYCHHVPRALKSVFGDITSNVRCANAADRRGGLKVQGFSMSFAVRSRKI